MQKRNKTQSRCWMTEEEAHRKNVADFNEQLYSAYQRIKELQEENSKLKLNLNLARKR